MCHSWFLVTAVTPVSATNDCCRVPSGEKDRTILLAALIRELPSHPFPILGVEFPDGRDTPTGVNAAIPAIRLVPERK
jgi:hypothetical protein